MVSYLLAVNHKLSDLYNQIHKYWWVFGICVIHNGTVLEFSEILCAKIVDFDYVCSICYNFDSSNIPLSSKLL